LIDRTAHRRSTSHAYRSPSQLPNPESVNVLRPLRAVLLGMLVVATIAGCVAAVTGTALVTHPVTGSPAAAAPSHPSPSLRGRITAVGDTQWTVAPAQGAPVTVEIAPDTQFGTPRRPVDGSAFTVGKNVGVIGARQGDQIAADRIIMIVARTQARPTPAKAGPTVTPKPAAPDSCAVTADLNAAVAYATGKGERSAVAVLDTQTGAYATAGAADTPFNTASVVKVFLATNLLLTGQMSGSTATTAQAMISQSDDDAADALYDLAGGDQVVTIIEQHYGIPDLGSPPADAGQWGETQVTADGLAHLYADLEDDTTVWPWLSKAMATATRTGADGTDQYFGIPSASDDWAVKQGWMTGLGPGSTYDSTGYVDGSRYVVVLLTYGSAAQYGSAMAATITQMARLALPGGIPGGSGPTSTDC
jgi:hypothetical protein